MKDRIELYPLPIKKNKQEQIRSCLIKRALITDETILWFKLTSDIKMPEDSNCDSYLLATLLPAMQIGADIIVHGSVSKNLLSNLTELQLVWHKWCPGTYNLINIKVNTIREKTTVSDDAVIAFSGGADAQFSAYQHITGHAGYSTQKIIAGVLVHGFDITLADNKGFSGAEKLAIETLDNLGVRLIPVKTNLRELWTINWEHYCGSALAAVLTGFERFAGVGLVGSGESYDSLVTPWGSHPVTDPLLSTDTFKIIHDGAGYNRSEKIKILSNWEVGMKNLRVCWAGVMTDRNCGECEKCMRTRLNFLLAGIREPICFSTPLNEKYFRAISLRSDAARAEWKMIHDEILDRRVGLEWLPHVKKVIKRNPSKLISILLPIGSQRRLLAKKLKEKFRND